MTGRKPLRRTAWSMLIGGVAATALMLGGSAVVIGHGETASSAEPAVWPAGVDIGVFRSASTDSRGTACTVTQPDGRTSMVWPRFGERLRSESADAATIACAPSATVLSEGKLAVARITRSEWIALPLIVMFLGALLFVPRVTMLWTSLSRPFGNRLRRRV
nr:hypothetical protein [Kibdelosporangium sp. MJ126-NF4]CTQ96537.1 hypothetical protein [Kibdelosporangium sp. MJ126-NF4]